MRAIAQALQGKIEGWDGAKKTVKIISYSGSSFSIVAIKVLNRTAFVSAKEISGKLNASLDEKALTIKKGKSAMMSEQWAKGNVHDKSSWGQITQDSPVNRDNCIACHDGQGFALQKTKRADLPEAVRNTPNSIDCSACHSERGKAIMSSGKTPVLANGYQVLSAGKGALCMTCHNGRRAAAASPKPDSNPAPHGSVQTDMLYGFGGYGFDLPFSTSPHGANPDTCVGCHMASKSGVKDHGLKITDPEAACAPCHTGLKTINRPALGDYDGDKVVEGIKDEVQGLVDILNKAIDEAVPNGVMSKKKVGRYSS